MATRAASNDSTIGFMDRGSSVTSSAVLNVKEVPGAAQEIIDIYQTNDVNDEPDMTKPPKVDLIPQSLGDNERNMYAMSSERGKALGEDTVQLKGSSAPTYEAQVETEDTRDGCCKVSGKIVGPMRAPKSVISDNSVAGKPEGISKGNGSSTSISHPSLPPTYNNQNSLLAFVTCITHNIYKSATDDTYRIKAATAALELAAVLRPPSDIIMGWFANMSVISAVRLFIHWGAFAVIPTEPGERISYTELAERVNADEKLLVRVASMLTSAHILLHHPPSPSCPGPSLAHTPTSLLLLPGQPMSAMFSLMYNNVTAVSTILPSYFDVYGRKEPPGPEHVPTSYLAGHPEESFFSLLRKDETALREFGLAMRMASKRVPVTGVYDMTKVLRAAAEEGRETVWVDIGGGDGHTVKEFLDAYPGLRAEQCVVQDLEEVIEAAKEQNLGALKGVRWVAIDFFKEAPVQGALVYYLRHILRDYSDLVSVTILRNIARAMTDPDSRILISEQLSPDMANMTGPLPLYAAFKDFSMLSIGGKERSLKQFAELADAAGLKVSGVFEHAVTAHAVVELALKGAEGA